METKDRREFMNRLTRSILSSLKTSVSNRYSGGQIAYAKGRAWQQMQRMGF